jgi:hypothetical protein
LAKIIPFPVHRVRRPARSRKARDVFGPLREAFELERAESRFVWACTALTTIVGVTLQVTLL